MGLTLSQLQDVKTSLASLPPNDDPGRALSHQEVVAGLAEEIASLQERAYTIDDIARLLNKHGVAISVHTLRTYLTRIRAQNKDRSALQKKTPKRIRINEEADKLKTPSKTTEGSASTSARDKSNDPHQDSSSASHGIAARTLDAGQRRLDGGNSAGSPGAVPPHAPARKDGKQDAGLTRDGIPSRTPANTPIRTETRIPPATRAQVGVGIEANPGAMGTAPAPGPKVATTPNGPLLRSAPISPGGPRVVRSSSFEPSPDTPDI